MKYPRPHPRLPPGFHNTAEFGDALGWGRFDEAARNRAATITLDEIIAVGITREIALAWLDLYEWVIKETPRNPSARGRAGLMRRIIELLEEHDA